MIMYTTEFFFNLYVLSPQISDFRYITQTRKPQTIDPICFITYRKLNSYINSRLIMFSFEKVFFLRFGSV